MDRNLKHQQNLVAAGVAVVVMVARSNRLPDLEPLAAAVEAALASACPGDVAEVTL